MYQFSGIAQSASVREPCNSKWQTIEERWKSKAIETTDQITQYCLDLRLKWCEVVFRSKCFLCTRGFSVQAKTNLVLRTTSSMSFEKILLSPRRMGYVSSTCWEEQRISLSNLRKWNVNRWGFSHERKRTRKVFFSSTLGWLLLCLGSSRILLKCVTLRDKPGRTMPWGLVLIKVMRLHSAQCTVACVAWRFKLFFKREWSGSSRLWGLLSRFPRLKTAQLRRRSAQEIQATSTFTVWADQSYNRTTLSL